MFKKLHQHGIFHQHHTIEFFSFSFYILVTPQFQVNCELEAEIHLQNIRAYNEDVYTSDGKCNLHHQCNFLDAHCGDNEHL